MTTIFLPLNGIGLGHLSRAFVVAERLQARGQAPVIFAQGSYPEYLAAIVPGISVGTLYQMETGSRSAIATEIENYARLAPPTPTIIEDTHPAPLTLAPDIQRFLLVRPTSIDYMRSLNIYYGGAYRAFLIRRSPSLSDLTFLTR